MSRILTLAKRFLTNRQIRFGYLTKLGFYNQLSDEAYLKRKFALRMGKKLDLENPQTFNEKLQWLKLHDRKPIYTAMVDKYAAKKYVADIIGEEYIIPTFDVWERFDDINFDALPEQFVLKCTHDCGSVIIVRDKNKFDKATARKKLSRCLKQNYFWLSREWPYKNVKPRIIAEKYMQDLSGEDVCDYKIHNFNGVPRVILVCKNRFAESGMTEDFFDCSWKHLDISRIAHPNADTPPEAPARLMDMVALSRKLSAKIPFLRTDFYQVGDKLYFGELTFFPAGGSEPFEPEEWDKTLGDWLQLPDLTGGG